MPGPDHLVDQPRLADRRSRALGDVAAVAEHRDAVRNTKDVFEEMRDEDDALARCAEAPQDAEQQFHLGRRQGRGRLVQDDDAGPGEYDPGDLDQLLQADRQRSDALAGVEVEPEIRQLAARRLPHAAPAYEPARPRRLLAKKHVLGHGQVGHGREFLVHHADAGRDALARRPELHLPASHGHPTTTRPMHARDDLHEGGFAGAVLAHEAVDLALLQREINAAQGLHAAEALGHAGHLEGWWGHRASPKKTFSRKAGEGGAQIR